MTRITALAFSLLMAAGCATTARVDVIAGDPSQAAMELECMADCLGDSEASCEDCADRCFAPPQGVLLGLKR